MSPGFSPVDFSWDGDTYTVPADRIFPLIQQVEDALARDSARQAVEILLGSGGPSHTRLAAAYGAALRYAGAQVEDGEIYLSIQQSFVDRDPGAAEKINALILSLLAICSPPAAAQIALANSQKANAPKKTDPDAD